MWIDTSQVHDLAADIQRNADEVEPKAQLIVSKTAVDVTAAAQVNAPVLTGALKSSISPDVDGLSFEVGPTVEYGGYVELGTSRMSPQPYLGPAFDAKLPKALEAFSALGGQIVRG